MSSTLQENTEKDRKRKRTYRQDEKSDINGKEMKTFLPVEMIIFFFEWLKLFDSLKNLHLFQL